jgi:hypothetical protein
MATLSPSAYLQQQQQHHHQQQQQQKDKNASTGQHGGLL